jgi:hypothetical protein
MLAALRMHDVSLAADQQVMSTVGRPLLLLVMVLLPA